MSVKVFVGTASFLKEGDGQYGRYFTFGISRPNGKDPNGKNVYERIKIFIGRDVEKARQYIQEGTTVVVAYSAIKNVPWSNEAGEQKDSFKFDGDHAIYVIEWNTQTHAPDLLLVTGKLPVVQEIEGYTVAEPPAPVAAPVAAPVVAPVAAPQSKGTIVETVPEKVMPENPALMSLTPSQETEFVEFTTKNEDASLVFLGLKKVWFPEKKGKFSEMLTSKQGRYILQHWAEIKAQYHDGEIVLPPREHLLSQARERVFELAEQGIPLAPIIQRVVGRESTLAALSHGELYGVVAALAV